MTYTESVGFGSGFMYMTPLGGNNLTPIRVGILQDVSFDISFDEKPLYGQNQWPVMLARGKAKGAIKCHSARIDSGAIASIFFGAAPQAGQDIIVDLEAGVVPASSPFTVAVVNVAHWTKDNGVAYALTGQPLTLVTSGPTAGQYSVAAGIYTFAAADEGAAVLISYTYNSPSSGFKTSIVNQPMGSVSYFQTDLYQNNPETAGAQWGVRLYRCASNKLSLASKQDDWMIPEFDASVQANAAGKVLDFNTPS